MEEVLKLWEGPCSWERQGGVTRGDSFIYLFSKHLLNTELRSECVRAAEQQTRKPIFVA